LIEGGDMIAQEGVVKDGGRWEVTIGLSHASLLDECSILGFLG
jgi:hypothetical protein